MTDSASATLWGRFEIVLNGPQEGNPFLDVTLSARFEREGQSLEIPGFYDGEGVYRIRFLPVAEGNWRYVTKSNVAMLDGVAGEVHVGPAKPGDHGPVRTKGLHFRYADGSRYINVGTTAYVWNLQGEALEQQTLATLADAPFTKGRKPAFHTPLDNFVKLRLWEMEEYDRVVFLDADTIVLRGIDRLFGYPEFSAAPNVYESLSDFHRLNSGVFVATPSRATFAAMLVRLDTPDAFWRRTDQTFLETFFPDWHGLPVFDNMLQYVWFNLPELWDWTCVRVIHYQYEKPWEDGHPKAERLKPLIDLWKAVDADLPIPDSASLPNPIDLMGSNP